MKKPNPKLTRDERVVIGPLHKAGNSARAIAEVLGRHRTTIRRELQRNALDTGIYAPIPAQVKMVERKARAAVKFKGALKSKVESLLIRHQSPAEICERLRRENAGVTVCAETIYQHIYKDAGALGWLHGFTASRRKRRKSRQAHRVKRGPIPGRVDIGQRPAEVAALKTYGHWEGDTVHGVNGAMVTLVERISGMVRMVAVPNLKTTTVVSAILKRMAGTLVKSITFDNGSEFADHARLSKGLWTTCYFATPGCPYQRGRNENRNRQLRALHRKGTVKYRYMRKSEVKAAEDRLNNKLCKRLGWKCANDSTPELLIRHGPSPPPEPPRQALDNASRP